MRILLLIGILFSGSIVYGQSISGLCDVIRDVETYSADGTMSKIQSEKKNFYGSYNADVIPARFVESKFRDLGDGDFFLEYYSYGTRKQMDKVLKALQNEVESCYSDYIMEEKVVDNEDYRKLFFCHQSEKGRSQNSADYTKMNFMLTIVHSADESKITLSF